RWPGRERLDDPRATGRGRDAGDQAVGYTIDRVGRGERLQEPRNAVERAASGGPRGGWEARNIELRLLNEELRLVDLFGLGDLPPCGDDTEGVLLRGQ